MDALSLSADELRLLSLLLRPLILRGGGEGLVDRDNDLRLWPLRLRTRIGDLESECSEE